MCLENPRTDNLDQISNKAWKIVGCCYYYGIGKTWRTPYRYTEITGDTLEAVGSPIFTNTLGEPVLAGGAIHCYRSKDRAENDARYILSSMILEVEGSGPIAYNDEEIAFKSVRFINPPWLKMKKTLLMEPLS